MGFNGGFLVRVCVIWVSGYSYLKQDQILLRQFQFYIIGHLLISLALWIIE